MNNFQILYTRKKIEISRLSLSLLLVLLQAITTIAQEGKNLIVTKLNNTLYKFSLEKDPYSTNMIVSIGEDGMLLVDTGYREYIKAIKRELNNLGDTLPVLIINTHLHQDHTGNNDSFENDPIIIAHENVFRDMEEGRYMHRGLSERSKPDSLINQSTSIYFNGEEIKIVPIIGSHSDGDMVVYFTESKIMVMGDIGYGMKYPSFDLLNGNTLLYAESINRALDINDGDITYISGHGKNMNRADMMEFSEMLLTTSTIVKDEVKRGKDFETIMTENNFEEWRSYEGGYNDNVAWINGLYLSCLHPEKSIAIIPILLEVYSNEGIEATIKKFYKIRKGVKKEIIIIANLSTFSNILYARHNDIDGAIEILKVLEKSYYDHDSNWITYANLGNYYIEKNEIKLAKKYLKKSLAIKWKRATSDKLKSISNK